MPSIIIPAHNEACVIDRSLRSLIDHLEDPEFEVIVVCNGCTDQTANKVREISDKIICIETDKASKANALNLGDTASQFYPKIYLDADVSISISAIDTMIEVLNHQFLATAPEVEMNVEQSNWMVKAYYDIWLSLPYCKAGMIGAGVYALSQEGRTRFTTFPMIIADDGYIRCLFNEQERGLAAGCHSVVTAPKNIRGLIKIKTRSRLGRYELAQQFSDLIQNEKKDYWGALNSRILEITSWHKLLIYLTVNFITKLRAKGQLKAQSFVWERDDTSR